MDLDPLQKLSKRIRTLQKQRDELEKKIAADRQDVEKLQAKLERLKKDVEVKKSGSLDVEEKGAKIDSIIKGTESAIRRLVETSVTLEKSLEL